MNLGGPEPHDQFARHPVAPTELLRPVRAHVAARDRGGRGDEVAGFPRQLRIPLHLNERVRGLLQVDADRGARIAP